MTWLPAKSKPCIHLFILLCLNASIPILPCASNSSPWCLDLATLSCPSIFHSPVSLPQLEPESMTRTSPPLMPSQDNHRARNKWRPASLCFLDGTSLFLHTFPITSFEVYVWPSTFLPSGYEWKVLISSSRTLKTLAQVHSLPLHSCG